MSGDVRPTDRGDATVWMMILTPVVMILCLVLIVVLWVNTNIVVALIAFGLLCAGAWAVADKLRRRSRGF